MATSQGNRIVSPATNLNVSERDIKLGSGLFTCGVAKKKNIIEIIIFWFEIIMSAIIDIKYI